MSLTTILIGAGLVISHSVVAIFAAMWGKAHPTVVSALAADVAKVEKKV